MKMFSGKEKSAEKEIINITVKDNLIQYKAASNISVNNLTYCLINVLEDIAQKNDVSMQTLVDTYLIAQELSGYAGQIPRNFIKLWGDESK